MNSRIVALVVLSCAAPLAFAEPPPAAPATAPHASVRVVSSAAFHKSPDGATLIDVREPAEWAATGMPASARGVPLSSPDFIERVLTEIGGDKSKPVAVICRSGSRSTKAADKLAAAGFTNVTNVGDGMIGRSGVGDGWLASKLPLKTYQPAPAN